LFLDEVLESFIHARVVPCPRWDAVKKLSDHQVKLLERIEQNQFADRRVPIACGRKTGLLSARTSLHPTGRKMVVNETFDWRRADRRLFALVAGVLILIASYPLRMAVSGIDAWLSFAGWLTTWAA